MEAPSSAAIKTPKTSRINQLEARNKRLKSKVKKLKKRAKTKNKPGKPEITTTTEPTFVEDSRDLEPTSHDSNGCALFSDIAYRVRRIRKVREMIGVNREFCLVMVEFEDQGHTIPIITEHIAKI